MGPRRGPPGLEEAASKKKQKDRANQESKDGDPRRGGRHPVLQARPSLASTPSRGGRLPRAVAGLCSGAERRARRSWGLGTGLKP